MNFKPMLCENKVKLDAMNLHLVRLPVMVSFKLDGQRAIVTDKGPRTRALKRIGNIHVRNMLASLPPGLDGELAVIRNGVVDFRGTSSAIRNAMGTPEFKFFVFDIVDPNRRALERYSTLLKLVPTLPPWVAVLHQEIIGTLNDLQALYAEALRLNYEGVCLKNPQGWYKNGRSTFNEQYLMRIKEYETDEALVIGMEEEMENFNAQQQNELGYAKRSSSMENLYGKGRMGALVCKSEKFREPFKIGSGFDAAERLDLWANTPLGKIVHYRYDPTGGYDKPRQPVFKGFREAADL